MLDPKLNRRAFLATTAAAALLAACGGPPGPAEVTVAATGGAGMNAGPDGADRPVTLSIMRLKDAGAFNTADYFALQEDAAGALGADLIGMDQVVVAPGASVTKTLAVEPEATSLGIVASLRDPTGKVWRTVTPVAPGSTVTVTVALGSSGLGVTTS
jgi:type VI secretion system protein VasD